MAQTVLKPSQVLRMVKAGTLADPQPRGLGRIFCEEFRHPSPCSTESPTFWENGMYTYCDQCKDWKLVRAQFGEVEIDLTGERKQYPLTRPSEEAS